MRLLLSTLVLIAVSAPSFAADDKKIDIMNPYKDEQRKVTEKSLETNKEYNDRWYDYVEERYGGKIERPAADAYVTQVKAAESKTDDKKTDAAKSEDSSDKPESPDESDK